MDTTLIVAGVLRLASATALGVLGVVVLRRWRSTAPLERTFLAAWWILIATFALLNGLWDLAVGVGAARVELASLFRYATLLVLCVASWALASYFLFARAQNVRAVLAAGVAYAILYFSLVFLVLASGPEAVTTGAFWTDIAYREEPAQRVVAAAGVAFAFPPMVGAVDALWRTRRAEGVAEDRLRVRVFAGGIAIWYAAAFLSLLLGTRGFEVVARPALGLGVAGANLAVLLRDRI